MEVMEIAMGTPAALVVRITGPMVGVAMSFRGAGKKAAKESGFIVLAIQCRRTMGINRSYPRKQNFVLLPSCTAITSLEDFVDNSEAIVRMLVHQS